MLRTSAVLPDLDDAECFTIAAVYTKACKALGMDGSLRGLLLGACVCVLPYLDALQSCTACRQRPWALQGRLLGRLLQKPLQQHLLKGVHSRERLRDRQQSLSSPAPPSRRELSRREPSRREPSRRGLSCSSTWAPAKRSGKQSPNGTAILRSASASGLVQTAPARTRRW